MKFSEMKYERPDIKKVLSYIDETVEKLNNSKTAKEQIDLVYEFDEFNKDFKTSCNLVNVRHTINTKDEFYDKENEFLDKNLPIVFAKFVDYNKALYNSKFRSELEKEFGKHLFELLECGLILNNDAIPYMQKENELISEYVKLIANSEIEYDGKVYTLTQMGPFLQDMNREKRKKAYRATNKFFADNEATIDRIYDDMVKVRTEMAKKLGFENYTQLQYKLLRRTDYDANDVEKYREKVLKCFTPIGVKLRKEQAERLGIEDFKFYDWAIEFLDGNPNPKGDDKFIVENAQKMYRELSEETGEFFDFMVENELLDLVAKPGKSSGGYCTSFDKYKSPFIFSNFNGTKGDIDVVTHEAGHAFQNYLSQKTMVLSDYIWPTYESCEIHSMSMEFLTWPWMELFFNEDAKKYKFAALKHCLTFIPYGVTIDHFQHFVYENPNATPEERKAKFHEIEMMYMPDRDYDDEFLEKGTWWYKQGHIFKQPFYYIDYTLAQVCAFQYLLKSLKDSKSAFEDYLTLCKAGGCESFFNLLKIGNIENPMTTSIMEDIAPELERVLNNIL